MSGASPEPKTGAVKPISNEISTEPLLTQLRDFPAPFWIANVMEMLERLAYYGLRTVLPVYMVLAVEEGGPQFDHIQKGAIYAAWAAVQSFLPVVTGGYADRYGYKNTVGVSIAIKCIGYLVMAYAIDLASMITSGASDGVAGDATVYSMFMVGALALAAGTAIFKPGLQGIIAVNLPDHRSSLGWSVFYQLVNVGGFLGPILAGVMRLMAWKWVFISCAVIVTLNYLLFFAFDEPEKPEVEGDSNRSFLKVLWDSAIGITEPRLMAFLVIFSGFWMMFYQLFDLLPNFIDDWVDSRDIVDSLVRPLFAAFGGSVPTEWHGHLPQEYMININAGMCMLFAFYVGFLTGKFRSMTAMIAGILVAAGAIWALGASSNGWWTLAAIAMFSLGELMASPTKMRYFAGIAPPGKKALYLGYINATTGIGWAIGSKIAGKLYEEGGDKVVLARRFLIEQQGMSANEVTALAKTAVLPKLAALRNIDTEQARVLLWDTYEPWRIWATFALIGVVSMVGLLAFDRVTRAEKTWEPYALVGLAAAVS
jgi:dipeptide/tripeptide permease